MIGTTKGKKGDSEKGKEKLNAHDTSGGILIFDNAVPVDGIEVTVDTKMRRFGNAAKNVTIEGRDAAGNTSFEPLLRMVDRPICYVRSGSTVMPFPADGSGEWNHNGDTYDPPLDRIRVILSSTG